MFKITASETKDGKVCVESIEKVDSDEAETIINNLDGSTTKLDEEGNAATTEMDKEVEKMLDNLSLEDLAKILGMVKTESDREELLKADLKTRGADPRVRFDEEESRQIFTGLLVGPAEIYVKGLKGEELYKAMVRFERFGFSKKGLSEIKNLCDMVASDLDLECPNPKDPESILKPIRTMVDKGASPDEGQVDSSEQMEAYVKAHMKESGLSKETMKKFFRLFTSIAMSVAGLDDLKKMQQIEAEFIENPTPEKVKQRREKDALRQKLSGKSFDEHNYENMKSAYAMLYGIMRSIIRDHIDEKHNGKTIDEGKYLLNGGIMPKTIKRVRNLISKVLDSADIPEPESYEDSEDYETLMEVVDQVLQLHTIKVSPEVRRKIFNGESKDGEVGERQIDKIVKETELSRETVLAFVGAVSSIMTNLATTAATGVCSAAEATEYWRVDNKSE